MEWNWLKSGRMRGEEEATVEKRTKRETGVRAESETERRSSTHTPGYCTSYMPSGTAPVERVRLRESNPILALAPCMLVLVAVRRIWGADGFVRSSWREGVGK